MAYSKGRRLGVLVDTTGALQDPAVLTFLGITDGSAGQVLKTDGSGNLSFVASNTLTVTTDKITEGNTEVEVTDTGSDGTITLKTEGTNRWQVTNAGHILPVADNTYDIGSSSYKIRDIYVSDGSIKMGSDTVLTVSSGEFQINDASGDPKKLIVDEIELGTGNNKVILKKGSDGNFEQQTKSGGSTGTARKPFLLGAHTTNDITEHSSAKFFTEARARASVSVSGDGSYNSSTGVITINASPVTAVNSQTGSVSLNTSHIAESGNLYFTDARARTAHSVTDAGGDGSLAYNSSTGVITYTGPSAAEVRAHFSNGTGVSISNGQVSIGQAVGTSSNVTFNDLIVSGNLTVNGTNTILNTSTLTVDDKKITIADGAGSSSGANESGFEIGVGAVGASTNPSILYYHSGTKFVVNKPLDVTGNITLSGTVDGRDIASDGSKLDGIAASANNYSLPLGTSSARGGFKIGYTESGKNYPVELSSEQMYVNVPWTNTTYSVGDGGLTQKNFTTTLKTKLDGIETSATADQTATEILTAIKTVDGSGSGLDADLLDGQHGSYYYAASNPSGYTTNTGTLTATNDRFYISDTRGANRAPSYYDDRYVQADFTQSVYLGISGGDSWATALTVSKWSSWNASHRQEQLIFAGTKLARRVATSDSAWSSAYTIWDSSTDGSGSGLDADLLDGFNSSSASTGSTVAVRDSSGDINARLFRSEYDSTNSTIGYIMTQIDTASNNYIRPSTPAQLRAGLGIEAGATADQSAAEILAALKTVDVNGTSGVNAGTFDGQASSYYWNEGSTGLEDTNRISSTSNFNNSLPSGFYQSSTASNMPGSSWHNMINVRHSNTANDHGFQIAMSYYNNHLYSRSYQGGSGANNGTYASWAKQWSSENDGSGSGLDADLLDGLELHTGRNNEVNKVVRTDGSGYIQAGWINSTSGATSSTLTRIYCSQDGYIRYQTPANFGVSISPHINYNTIANTPTIPTNNNQLTNGAGFITASNSSITNKLPLAGGTMTGTITSRDILVGANYHLMRSNHHSGHLEGSYNNVGANSYKSNPIYTIGSSYNPTDAALSNMYGIGYSHPNASFISLTGAGGWGMYVAADGDARVWLDGSTGVISSTGQHYVGSNGVWHAGNDGSGSGLDADTVDGIQGASFLRSDAADSFSGTLTMATQKALVANNYGRGVYGIYSATRHQHVWSMGTAYNLADGGTSVGNLYGISWTHTNIGTGYGSNAATGLGHQLNGRANGTLQWALGDGIWSSVTGNVWGASNDGSGSGLDADLLDGFNSAENGANTIHRLASNGYSQIQNWQNVAAAGIYSTTVNGFHFRPNGSFTYGTAMMNGTRNGYSGIVMDNGGDVVVGMYDTAGNGGDYYSGSWHYYYHRANDCVGLAGSTTSSSYGAYVNGALYATGDVVGSSDRRLKKNINTIENGLAKVEKLRGVTYEWKDTKESGSDENNVTPERMGVIAQEIIDIIPEVVTHDKENDRYGVSYGHLTGVLIEAIKELSDKVKELEKKLEEK